MLTGVISHYRIIRKLGQGGMGEVYLADDSVLGRKVAVKVLPEDSLGDDQARKRLLREAQAAATLDHPNICAIHEVGDEQGTSFIVMQYVEGETLSARLQKGPMPLKESLDIASQIATALEEAHSRGIIHRDIKPQNIIITPRGLVKVLDFGLAKILPIDKDASNEQTQSILTDAGMVIGTAPYMSPEQAKCGPVDARSDLFSLGAVLYECVTGSPAFTGSTPMEICARVIHEELPAPSKLNPRVPPELDRLTLKLLAKNPIDRHQSASDLVADLRNLGLALHSEENLPTQAALTVRYLPWNAVRRFVSGVRRRPRRALIVLIAAIVVAFLFWWAPGRIWRSGAHQPSLEAMHWYTVGVAAIRDGAYYQATKALERAISIDGHFALAHAQLAEAWMELDYSDRAKDELLRATSLVPNRSSLPPMDALTMDALSKMLTLDIPGAIDAYAQKAQQAPEGEKPQSYMDLGRAYEKNEDINKALECYEDVTRRDSQYPAAFLRLGILYGRQRDLEKATKDLQEAEALYDALGNFEGATEVLRQRGALFSRLDKLAEAREQLEKGLERARATTNSAQQISILLQLSDISYTETDPAQAQQYATEAISLAQSEGLENLTADGLSDLGTSYYARGDYEQAEKLFEQALDFARRNKGRRGEARALLSLGSLIIQKGDVDRGVGFVRPALEFYEKGGYRRETAQAYTLLGRAYRQKGNYDVALESFEHQLKLAEDLGDQSQVALSHSSIGTLLSYREQNSEALRHFELAYDIDKSISAQTSIGYDLMNCGRMLWQLGRYTEAEARLGEALAVANRPDGNKQLLAWVLLQYSRMALSQEHFRIAILKSRHVMELAAGQYKDIETQAAHTLGLAEALAGDPKVGIPHCDEAVALSRAAGNPRLLSGALLALAEAQLESGNAQAALKTAKEAQEIAAGIGQNESQSRAWLLAARASRGAGDSTGPQEYVSHAKTLFEGLSQVWGEEAYRWYLARPDVVRIRKQIDYLRTGSESNRK